MKYLIKILLAFAAITFTSSIASAGDKPKPLNEVSPHATKLSESTIMSTQNDTTTPVELSNPAKAIDNAISAPQKDPTTGNSIDIGQAAPEPAEAENAVNKATTEYNKPVHKAKKHSSKRSKKAQKASKSKKTKTTTKSRTSTTKKK